MSETTEQQYLEMADHCKNIVEKKDAEIKHLKDIMSEAEDDIRKIEYELYGINYLVNYKISQRERGADSNLYEALQTSIKKIQQWIDNSRAMLSTDLDDEDIILILENLE